MYLPRATGTLNRRPSNDMRNDPLMTVRKMFAVFLVSTFLLNCRASLPVRTFKSQEEAGTVQVAVQSMAPFDEDFINQLQPTLALTDDQAAAAITLSRIQDIQRFRAMLIEAGL